MDFLNFNYLEISNLDRVQAPVEQEILKEIGKFRAAYAQSGANVPPRQRNLHVDHIQGQGGDIVGVKKHQFLLFAEAGVQLHNHQPSPIEVFSHNDTVCLLRHLLLLGVKEQVCALLEGRNITEAWACGSWATGCEERENFLSSKMVMLKTIVGEDRTSSAIPFAAIPGGKGKDVFNTSEYTPKHKQDGINHIFFLLRRTKEKNWLLVLDNNNSVVFENKPNDLANILMRHGFRHALVVLGGEYDLWLHFEIDKGAIIVNKPLCRGGDSRDEIPWLEIMHRGFSGASIQHIVWDVLGKRLNRFDSFENLEQGIYNLEAIHKFHHLKRIQGVVLQKSANVKQTTNAIDAFDGGKLGSKELLAPVALCNRAASKKDPTCNRPVDANRSRRIINALSRFINVDRDDDGNDDFLDDNDDFRWDDAIERAITTEMDGMNPSEAWRNVRNNYLNDSHSSVVQFRTRLAQAIARRRVAKRLNPGNQSQRPGHTIAHLQANDQEFLRLLPILWDDETKPHSGDFWIRRSGAGNNHNPVVPNFNDGLPVFVTNVFEGLKTKSRVTKLSENHARTNHRKSLAFEDVLDFIPDDEKVCIKDGKRLETQGEWVRTYFFLKEIENGRVKSVLS